MRAKILLSLASTVLAVAQLATPGSPCSAQAGPAPRVQALSSGPNPAFSIVSIKRSSDSEADDWGMGIRGRNYWAVHVTANELIGWVYGINARQIEHAPDWLATERFDVDGLPESGAPPSRQQYRAMLQAALADRFSLSFHRSRKLLPVYVLSLGDGGLKIPRSADQTADPSWGAHQGWLSIKNMTFGDVAQVLQRTVFDRPVLDQTGLSDRYTFVLRWRPDETQFTQMQGVEVPQEKGTEDIEDIYTAGRQQLGVRIESKKALAPTIVIDTISHPSPN
jgi:uncharacterized protein (TIGR03435 family)